MHESDTPIKSLSAPEDDGRIAAYSDFQTLITVPKTGTLFQTLLRDTPKTETLLVEDLAVFVEQLGLTGMDPDTVYIEPYRFHLIHRLWYGGLQKRWQRVPHGRAGRISWRVRRRRRGTRAPIFHRYRRKRA